MDFLCSNFFQINDNIVTVKNDFARTTTISDMRKKFKYWSRYEIVSNKPEPLVDEIINPSDQLFNANSSETWNLYNMTNEVPPQDSNNANKNKEHKNFYPLSFKLREFFFNSNQL